MTMNKYVAISKYSNGGIVSALVNDLCSSHKYEHILFVRTPTTGDWLDNLLTSNGNVTRILYDTHKIKQYKSHPSTITVSHAALDDTLKTMNKKYDLICVDPFHEYTFSKKDFYLLSSFLTDDGLIICHDCFPQNKRMAEPTFVFGPWSGETYVAFIDFAHHHPDWFCGILNTDTGIGILSKSPFHEFRQHCDATAQEQFLRIHQQRNADAYAYFCKHCKEMTNIVSI